MTDRYNPFGLPYLNNPADTPDYSVDSRWPEQPSTADAYRMGGLAAMDQYRMQDAPHAVFGAYDRARGQEAKDEAALQGHQRRADALRAFAGQGEGPTDIRSPITGMNPVEQQRMADTIGNALAPDNVFDAATFFNPLKRLGAIGKALPALGGIVMGADPAEAGVLSKARAVLGGKVGGPTAHGIHVYHSSPHDFDRFDLSKIGTGEGAQVYGHGIYAAENPAVSGQGGQYWGQFKRRFPQSEQDAASTLSLHGFDRAQAIRTKQQEIDELAKYAATAKPDVVSFTASGPVPAQDFYSKLLDQARAEHELLTSGAPVGPRTYEVNFKVKPEELLDWDKGLHRQAPEIQRRLEAFGFRADPEGMKRFDDALLNNLREPSPGNTFGGMLDLPMQPRDPSGEQIYHQLGNARTATDKLRDAGIPGIRYLDQGSRNAGDWHLTPPSQTVSGKWMVKNNDYNSKGLHFDDEAAARAALAAKQANLTHNYVAFDPSKLDIMAKYGVVGGVPMGALAAQDNYRQ